MSTECTARTYRFDNLGRRQVVTDFSGGSITSDGGLVLIAAVDQRTRLSERVAGCFSDQRAAHRVQHEVEDLVAQRLYGIVQGYEDVNDHDVLRHDPMFGIALGKLSTEAQSPQALAGKSTLNRLEQAMHIERDLSGERYVKFNVAPERMEQLLVEVSLEQIGEEPKRMILDIDVTDDAVHGEQVGGFFNGYYGHICYAPVFIFCGRHLLAAKLRASNVDPAAEALPELQRVIGQIRQCWKTVEIVVRGDSAYSREDLMGWCEAQANVRYVLAHASNSALRTLTWGVEQRAKSAYTQQRQQIEQTLEGLLGKAQLSAHLDAVVPAQVWYQSIHYQTQDSWSVPRRVVCKLTYDANGPRRHFVVTSFSAQTISPARLHAEFYCPRGEMENRLKEHQLDLFSDRTSTHEFESNQLRLWFSSFAYVLMQSLRQHCLADTELAVAQCGTIRLKLLKVAAQIRITVRRVVIAFSSTWTGRVNFHHAYQRLQQLPRPG